MVSHRLVGSITRSVGPAVTLGALTFSASNAGSCASSSVQSHTSSPASASQPRAHRRRQRAHRIETARGRVDGDRLQRRQHPHPLLGDRRSEGVGVERLLLDRVQAGRHMVDAVGGQQPPGVLVEHGDLVGRGDVERVDSVVRHPADVGVHRLGRQLDALAVQCRQRGGHLHRAARRLGGDGRLPTRRARRIPTCRRRSPAPPNRSRG